MPSTVAYAGLALFTTCVLSSWFRNRIPYGLQLPPGPRRRLLIGNLFDLPRRKEWLTFHRWAKEYGDLVYLDVLGTSMLFVNSYELAQELFEKRGNVYSNRYQSTVYNDLLRLDWTFILMPYGETWRRYKALFNQYFGSAAVGNYQELQQRHVKAFLERLYQSPDNFRQHLRFILGAMVIETAYGIKVQTENDRIFVLSEDTIMKVTQAGLPGTYLVDILPVLKHIPAWFPGARFRRTLNALKEQVVDMTNTPVMAVKEAMSKGNAVSSVTSLMIEQFARDLDRPSDYEDLTKYVPGTAYVAAIDTLDCTILQFFLAMVLNPEVQRKAQVELDSVIESDALPSLRDRERLPYIQAIIDEAMRWNATTPIGVPHVLDTDDVIGNYFVPKGTIVFGNTWTLLRSTSIYGEDAHKFRPERFIDNNAPKPDFAFGYGRRVCAGRHYANNVLFLLVASVLHTFNILPVEGKDGSEYLEEDFDSGLVLRPKAFKCQIIPRSDAAMKLLDELQISN